MNKIKNKNRVKFGMALLLVFAMFASILGMFSGCGKPTANVNEETEQAEAGEMETAGGMEIEMSGKTESPVKLMAKQVISADEGIAAQSDNTFHLTATVEPPDAVNRAVDFTAAWENGGIGWASGKSVSDYIEILQSADGSPEADIRCKQAFGVPVIVTAAIRDDNTLYDTCKLSYVRKLSGSDYTISALFAGDPLLTWEFKSGNLNPSVDFINLDSSYDPQGWVFIWQNWNSTKPGVHSDCFHFTITDHYDSVYTKDYGDYAYYEISVAATSTYLNALYSAGFTTKVQAETYVVVTTSAFADYVLDPFVTATTGFTNYAQYINLRTKLRESTSDTMLRIKVKKVSDESYRYVTETIYNVKFNPSSVSVKATGVSLNTHELEF